MVAATDMPDYDDRPPTKQHYSRTHEKTGVYGLRNLYADNIKANEEIRIVVKPRNWKERICTFDVWKRNTLTKNNHTAAMQVEEGILMSTVEESIIIIQNGLYLRF